jgi:hypothetical protein
MASTRARLLHLLNEALGEEDGAGARRRSGQPSQTEKLFLCAGGLFSWGRRDWGLFSSSVQRGGGRGDRAKPKYDVLVSGGLGVCIYTGV